MIAIELGYVEVVSEKVEVNQDYGPDFCRQEYDAQAKAVAMAERRLSYFLISLVPYLTVRQSCFSHVFSLKTLF
ncbi:hypothetical protein [Methanobrevibacter sp. V74]|uniref:hypothetical protein n=1 Tax=Methanobrevibacter sp. V74 TaxID=3064279 RepID=UPI002736601B|nr:hypothetical protein [Methanobrevibacter sp. V74]